MPENVIKQMVWRGPLELRDRFWSEAGQTDGHAESEDFRAGPAPGGPGRRLGPGTLPAHPQALPGPGAKSIPFMGTSPFTPIHKLDVSEYPL